MIVATGISKSFGHVQAVKDVSFEIAPGQIVGLLGPNGAGKTTTIRMITGYLPPNSGSVSVCGRDTIHESLAARRNMGYLPEATPLYPEMRVRDYLLHRARLYGVRRGNRKPLVGAAMNKCWLGEVEGRRIGHLSKGYKQRVGLAAALLHDPKVLILDEPTSGLDPTQIRETRTLIRDLAYNRTVLVSSHILPEVEKTCDRIIIISRGTLRADGAPDFLLAKMQMLSPPKHILEVLVSGDETWSLKGTETERVMALVKSCDGVATVARDVSHLPLERRPAQGNTQWLRLQITPHPGHPDLRDAIAQTLFIRGVMFRELHRATPTLEQLFIRVIEAEESHSQSPAHAA